MNDHPHLRCPPPAPGDVAQPGTAPSSDPEGRALSWTLIRHPWVRAADSRSIGTDGDTQHLIDAERSIGGVERRAA
jgi:hypothetical protein